MNINIPILMQANRELGEVKEGFIEASLTIINDKFLLYSDFIFGMMIATALWLIYHRFIGLKYVKKSYEYRLQGKDDTINTLKALVSEKLENIDIPELKHGVLSKIKKWFNTK